MITHSLPETQPSHQKNQYVKTGVGNTRLNSQGGGLGEGTTPSLPGKSPDRYEKLAKPATTGETVRADRIEVKPDWINLIGEIELSRVFDSFRILEEATDEKLHLTGKPRSVGTKSFQYSGRSLNSLVVGWGDADEVSNKTECFISIPGKVLSAMSVRKIHDLLTVLVGLGFHCSKLDIAVDDYGKSIKPINIIKALEVKNFSKFQKHRIIVDSDKGFTIYFGRPESTRYTKFYNKEVESKGRVKSYRLETRFNNKVAHDVLLKWLSIKQENADWEKRSATYLIKSVIGSIDFIDRESKPEEKNLNRLDRLDWWQEFIDKLGINEGICHSVPTPKTSLEKATSWITRSVMRRLVCVLAAFRNDGKDWLLQRLEEAKLSLKEKHQVDIEQYTREYAQYKDEVNYGFSRNYAVT